MEKVKGNGNSEWGIIYEEFVKYEKPNWCFKRHEITREQWEKMTSRDELRFWKARGVTRNYTALGYGVIGHSLRRWGDNLKVLDRWNIVKVGTEYEPIDKSIDEV
jgi:hypothetical protein